MAATKKNAATLSKSQNEQLESLATTSGKIRYLAGEGFSRGDIARILNKRYQHVRNVLITPLKNNA